MVSKYPSSPNKVESSVVASALMNLTSTYDGIFSVSNLDRASAIIPSLISNNVNEFTPSIAVEEDANLYLLKFKPVPTPISRQRPLAALNKLTRVSSIPSESANLPPSSLSYVAA
eukprot:409264_1